MVVDPLAVLAEMGIDEVRSTRPVRGGEDTLLWRVETGARTYALRVMRAEQASVWPREVAAMRAAAGGGLPVPAVECELLWRGRPALLMEWCPGRTMLAELGARPWRAWSLATQLGRTQARLNRIEAPPELTAGVDAWIDWAAPDEVLRARLKDLAPNPDRLLHLDFHMLNVMSDSRQVTAVLDWTNAKAGDPRADAARTLSTMRVSPLPPSIPRPARLLLRILALAWWRGYRAIAGEPADMAAFHAWAGAAMVRNWQPRLEQPGHWLRAADLEPARRWTAYWRARAGL